MTTTNNLSVDELRHELTRLSNRPLVEYDDKTMPIEDFMHVYMTEEHDNKLETYPIALDNFKAQLLYINKFSKKVTLLYVDAEGGEEDELSEILSDTLERQNYLKDIIKKLEDELNVVSSDEEVLQEHKKILNEAKEIEAKIKALREELEEVHARADDTLAKLRGDILVTRQNGSSEATEEVKRTEPSDFDEWVNKTKSKTKSATSKALGSSASVLQNLQKKLSKDDK